MNAELQTGTREEYWLKNLRKVERLGYDLDRVLMVDDESYKLEKNHGNPIARIRVRAVKALLRGWPATS